MSRVFSPLSVVSSSLAALLVAGCMAPSYVTPGYQPSSVPASTTPAGSQEIVVQGGEGVEVLAEGMAALPAAGGADIARDQAINDALRKAVEQAVGTFINSETKVENFQLLSDRIYSQSTGYVSSYRIVTEGLEGALYRVVVRARVKTDNLENDLAAIGILVKEQGRPRVMVVVKDVTAGLDALGADQMNQTMLETRIIDRFQSKGFPVVDAATVRENLAKEQLKKILAGDQQAAAELGLRSGAEIIIAGTVQCSSRRTKEPYLGEMTDFYKTSVSARAINTETAEVLGATALYRDVPFSADQSREQAADSVAAELIGKILAGWKKRENVTVIAADNASFERVQKLASEIRGKLRGVITVVTRDLVGTNATVEVLSETSSQEIRDGLVTRGLSVPFDVVGFAGNRVEIRFKD